MAASSSPKLFCFFFFPASLAFYDEPDGVIVASERFQVTFPIAPRQYASFTSMVGSVEEAQAIYKEMLEVMVMQTMQRDLPDFLEGFLATRPEYPHAELRLHIDGPITVSGEACLVHEGIRVQDVFRLIEEPENSTETQEEASRIQQTPPQPEPDTSHPRTSSPPFAPNGLCLCVEGKACEHCLFFRKYNHPSGRKALCEKIVNFLVFKPFYQYAIKTTIEQVFPGKVIYEDEKDICSMLFESVLFEDTHIGKTPLAYFIDNAPLSPQEKHLYEAWQANTRYEFFLIEKIIPEQEIHLTDLLGKTHYKIYETSGTLTLTAGKVIIARIVPFLDGWMIMTEKVISFSNVSDEWKRESYGVPIPQFTFVKRYYEDQKRLRIN